MEKFGVVGFLYALCFVVVSHIGYRDDVNFPCLLFHISS